MKTTDSPKGAPPAGNILDQDFTATVPNQRWVGDVTYLRAPEGWLYRLTLLRAGLVAHGFEGRATAVRSGVTSSRARTPSEQEIP